MLNFDSFTAAYKAILHVIAETTVHTLELIGIIIIIVGTVRILARIVKTLRKGEQLNVMVDLGKCLALALEFKMGAEIVNTVIIRNIEELIVLAIVIALRAILALLLRWEINSERSDVDACKKQDKENKD